MKVSSIDSDIKSQSVSWLAARWRRWFGGGRVNFDGIYLNVDNKMPQGLRRALWRADYESAERAIVKRALKPTDRVLEGGGGLGLVSMEIARIVGNENLLVYEASPSSHALLSKHVAANGFSFEIRNKALSDKEGSLQFFVHDNVLSSSSIARNETKEISIPCDDIRSIVNSFQPNVLVLDVEGAEVDTLKRAPLNSIDKIIVEIHPHLVGDAALTGLYQHLYQEGFVLNHDNCWQKVLSFNRSAANSANGS
ncbi:FkbM family methyltransferase [Pararhizobium sp. IMCC21322]|uniref:FkbM family methyltransferase n=1 Tax=Pararhizobium sp. IMCC21322 TaxID=3067903 RepID=UPI0027427B6E|nr:FkbM family methyltransferase [Pararhizobium sp. IMCC21322]